MIRRPLTIVIFFIFFVSVVDGAVPKFEAVSVTDSSLVIKLINGANVSHVDMTVHIYDLDRLEEFRKTELKSSDREELFSFDSLRADTWFAFRIHYRVLFLNEKETGKGDFITKQELVVRTKSENSALSPTTVEDVVASVEETFKTTADLYVSVTSEFKQHSKVMTVVVPELRCPGRGVVKPLAQQIINHARFHFDLNLLGDGVELIDCDTMCLFPFLRVAIHNRTSETFRAREWCGNIQRVVELGRDSTNSNHISFKMTTSLVLTTLALLRLV